MKVKFANGLVFDAESIDDAVQKCIASGNDPFKPEITQDNIETEHNADQE